MMIRGVGTAVRKGEGRLVPQSSTRLNPLRQSLLYPPFTPQTCSYLYHIRRTIPLEFFGVRLLPK